MSMLEDEQESWRLLLDDAERQGEFDMSIQDITLVQRNALMAVDTRPTGEAAAWAQVIAQCEIALQLQAVNEKQETRIEQADTQNALLLRIAIAVEALNKGV